MFNPKERRMIDCIIDMMNDDNGMTSDQACNIVANLTPFTENELLDVWAFWVECD